MSKKELPDWLENALIKPEVKFKVEDLGCTLIRDFRTVRTGKGESDWEVRPMDNLFLFLDHWLITRKDGDTVLNGTPEDFEKQLRELIDARTIENS